MEIKDFAILAPDGSWIGRANRARFPWERRSTGGENLRHYYPREHCLESDPLQIETDVWGMLDQKLDNYSFITIKPEGEPVEMTGARLPRHAIAAKSRFTTYRQDYDPDK